MFADPAVGTDSAPGAPCFVGWEPQRRMRLFTGAARRDSLDARAAIMPVLSEVAPYDFRP